MQETIELKGAHVAGVKADMLKGTVKITFEVLFDQQILAAKRSLSVLAFDGAAVDLTIREQQLRLDGIRVFGLAGETVTVDKDEHKITFHDPEHAAEQLGAMHQIVRDSHVSAVSGGAVNPRQAGELLDALDRAGETAPASDEEDV